MESAEDVIDIDAIGSDARPEHGTCSECGDKVSPSKVYGRWFPPATTCEGCRDRHTASEEDKSRELAKGKVERAIKSKRHRKSAKEIDVDLVEPLAECIGGDEPGPSCYLHGPVGTGKTTQATAATARFLYRRVVRHDDTRASARVISEPKLFAELREAIGGDGSPEEVMEEYREVDLLVLDDLGTSRATPWVAENLYLLINQRYCDMRPIVFTSNHSLSGLARLQGGGGVDTEDPYDDRVVSRIGEMVGDRVVELAEDYRAGAGD